MYWDKVTLNSAKVKSVSLELCLAEGIGQLEFFRKEGFRGDLKTYLGLSMPNQYCQAGYVENVRLVFGQENIHLHHPYCTVLPVLEL